MNPTDQIAERIESTLPLGDTPLAKRIRVEQIGVGLKAAIEKALAAKDELHAAALQVLERHHKAAIEEAVSIAKDEWNEADYLAREQIPSDRAAHASEPWTVDRMETIISMREIADKRRRWI